jgi:eukaryotic-like serine/threonine-protein kinase
VSAAVARRYLLLSRLGSGGFGDVYRARLLGPAGFVKEVALKLLRDDAVSPDALARFRDEARILGLVRDRALVSVDPPVLLGGRWALVMDLLEGRSAHALLATGPFPPRAALEVVAEVARVLAKVWDHPGPDGEPLRLLHRDLKPSNLQITPDGDVKLLDFGVATARFAAREARTTTSVGGTIGYIAPERIDGIDGPEGDVYALGLVLRVLATRVAPPARRYGDTLPAPRPLVRILALADAMTSPDPVERPLASEVERACRALLESAEGESLRQWAPTAISALEREAPGPDDAPGWVGAVLAEGAPAARGRRRSRRRTAWLALTAGAALTVAAVGGVLLAAVIVAAGWLAVGERPDASVSVLVPIEPPAAPPAREDPPPDRASDGPSEAPPPEEPPRPRPAAAPTPAPVVVPAPGGPAEEPEVAQVDEPAPSPDPARSLTTATFESVPPGAIVVLDGATIGRTPLRDQFVSVGPHDLRFDDEGGGSSGTRGVLIGGRNGARWFGWDGEQFVTR